METEEGMLVTSAIRDITERKRTEEALASVNHRLIEAQEQERARIARDLHDDLGQRLALLTVELDQLQQDFPDLPAEVRRRVGAIHQQASEIACDLQTLSHELHSSKLEILGIAAATRSFCQEFGEQHNLEIDFKTHDLPGDLPHDVSLGLFRVLQEALHNSAKHSGVRRVEVVLQGTSQQIHLSVSDAGRGFDGEAAKHSRGLGLVSMEERIKILHGTFSIDSRANNGTTVRASVPFNVRTASMAAGE